MDNISNESKFLKEGISLIGRYEIQNVIGAGGFGITYKAWDMLTDQNVCIKEFYPSGMVSRQHDGKSISLTSESYRNEFTRGKKRFLSEAKELLRFKDSPSIVNVTNFFEDNSTAYMAMEYLEGCTLLSYLRQIGGTLDVQPSFYIMDKIMSALEEIHNAGIIHRDISPDNIFILPDYSVKLIDFGAAKQSYSGETQNLSIMLKPGYAPAEQYTNNSPQGPWTDIYAFAATMYRMMTGKKPEESINRVLNDEFVPPNQLNPKIPQYLNDAIVKAMAVRREDRFQSIAEFRQAAFNQNQVSTSGMSRQILVNPKANINQGNVQIGSRPMNSQYARPLMNQQNNSQRVYSSTQEPTSNDKKKLTILCSMISLVVLAFIIGLVVLVLPKDKKSTKTTATHGSTQDSNATAATTQSTTQSSTQATTEAPTNVTNDVGLIMPDPNSNEKLRMYADDEFDNTDLQMFESMYPEYAGRIEITNFPSDQMSYVDDAVRACFGTSDAYDIVYREISDYQKIYADPSLYADIEQIGITKQMYSNSYKFMQDWATVNNKLMAVTSYVAPFALCYRRDIALEIFGTDDPDYMSQLLGTTQGYLDAAEKLKAEGYYINGSIDEVYMGSLTDTPYDTFATDILNGGYSKQAEMWSNEWYQNGSEDIFAYFGPGWLVQYCLREDYDWMVCESPLAGLWGGMYFTITKDCLKSTEKQRLAALFLYTVGCDADYILEYCESEQLVPNNKISMDAICSKSNYSMRNVKNDNPYLIYKKMTEKYDR